MKPVITIFCLFITLVIIYVIIDRKDFHSGDDVAVQQETMMERESTTMTTLKPVEKPETKFVETKAENKPAEKPVETKDVKSRFDNLGAFYGNSTQASKTVGSFYKATIAVTLVAGRTYEITADSGADVGTVVLATDTSLNGSTFVHKFGVGKHYIFTADTTDATALYLICYVKTENTDAANINVWLNDLTTKYNLPVLYNYRLLEQVSRVQHPIPDYFNTYLDGKIADINSAMAQSYNMDAFIFVTDNHISKNSLTSFPVMREILAHTAVDKVVFGGDVIYAYGTDSDIVRDANLNLKEFKGLLPYGKVFMAHGNHDFTIKTSASERTGYTYGAAFTYEYLTKMMEPYANVTPGKMYWYYDNPVQKIRYIGVDTSDTQTVGAVANGTHTTFSQDQADWLCDTLNVQSGWSVVVIGHIPILSGSATTLLQVLTAILKAYAGKTTCSVSYTNAFGTTVTVNKDFSAYNGTLVCYICGHDHHDDTTTSEGVLEIVTTADYMNQIDQQYTRTRYTTTEMAIDVVVIDKDNETIQTIRIGAGANRNFSY